MPRKRTGQKEQHENYNKAFPTVMRYLMEQTTQTELATALGKTRQAITYYCDGSSSPDWETLVKIADFFNVSTDYLLGRTKEPSMAPCATDELGLSPQATAWLLHLAEIEGPIYTKYLSILLESESFQILIHLLIKYFSALNADSIADNILEDCTSESPSLYPNCSTYFDKLSAAANDSQYDEATRKYLLAFYGFERLFLNCELQEILDHEDNDDENIIHLLDITELKIRRTLESTLQSIRDHHENQSV